MEFSDLHKKLIYEGFEPLGMFHNVEFASQNQSHYVSPLRKIIEEMHVAFRIIPAYLVYNNAPLEYKDRHILYIPTGILSKMSLLAGCETNTEDL